MKNPTLLKHYFLLVYSSVSPFSLFNIKQIQNCTAIIKIILIVFISSIVVKAQESIVVFSVLENTTNGVPTTSSITPTQIEEDQVLDLTPIRPLVAEPTETLKDKKLSDFGRPTQNPKPVIRIQESDLGQYAGKYLPTASLERYLKGDKTLDAEFALTENENVKKKSVALAIIGLIIIGVTIFMFNQNKESLGQADSKIKSIDENELKENLNTNNLDNSRIAEIDDNTLKQKLGL